MEFANIINYLSGFAVLATVYAVLALGLNVHWGATGLLNLGIAGFFALGAYTSAEERDSKSDSPAPITAGIPSSAARIAMWEFAPP